MSIDQLESKVIRAKRAVFRSRRAIAIAHDDLENHQRWLERHRAAWVEDVERHQRRLNYKLVIWTLKRVAVGIFLVGPLVCIALFRLTVRLLPTLRSLLSNSVSRFRALARVTRERVHSFLYSHAIKSSKTLRYGQRIPGLDGPLCTGQPTSSNATTRIASAGTHPLQVRLVVASLGVVVVGGLAAAMTPDAYKEPPEIQPTVLVYSGRAAALPQAVSNHPRAEGSNAKRASGFAVLTTTPVAELASLPGVTIADMMSIARPLPVAVQPRATETLDITIPVRKPKIQAKPRRKPTKPKRQLTLWEQLPWLR